MKTLYDVSVLTTLKAAHKLEENRKEKLSNVSSQVLNY